MAQYADEKTIQKILKLSANIAYQLTFHPGDLIHYSNSTAQRLTRLLKKLNIQVSDKPIQSLPKKAIVVVWTVEDVLNVREDLTRQQARYVLNEINQRCNPEIGVTWEIVDYICDEIFPKE